MKNITLFIGALLVSVLFTACPYESIVAIDTPSAPINQKLIGNWKPQESNEVYKISKHNDFTYAIDLEKDNAKTEHFFAHISIVNGVNFLNLNEIKPDSKEKKYILYKVELTDDNTLKVSPLTENIREKFASSEELKKFISENMKNSYFFEKDGLLTRVVKK